MPDGAAGAPAQEYPPLLSLFVHELRTPISVVAGYLRLLAQDAASPLTDRQRKMIDEADKSCARMSALVGELSELAKLDAGSARFATERLDVFESAAHAAAAVTEGADRGVRLQITGEATGAPMHGDRARLEKTFDSLFRAILREQPASCTVVGECRRLVQDGAASAVIVIAEASIAPHALNAPRARLDDLRGGLGLALPLAVRVIERHGGSIWSPSLPDGSAVVASFPLGDSHS